MEEEQKNEEVVDEHVTLFEDPEVQKHEREAEMAIRRELATPLAPVEITDADDWETLNAEEIEESKSHVVKLHSDGFVDSILKEVSQLRPSFMDFGFDFAETDWLAITVGTSSGFSVSLVPHPRLPDAPPTPPPAHGYSFLQRLALAVLKRADRIAQSLRSEHFELARVTLSLQGIGLAIPSATASLLLRELTGKEHEDVVSVASVESHESHESGHSEGGEPSFIHRIGERLSEAGKKIASTLHIGGPKKSRSVLQTIARDLRNLRSALEGCGFQLEPGGTWLGITVGTFVGVQLTVMPLAAGHVPSELNKVTRLTNFQRMVLSMVQACDDLSTAFTARNLRVDKMTFKFTGIGLAIPTANVRLLLRDLTADEKAEYEARLGPIQVGPRHSAASVASSARSVPVVSSADSEAAHDAGSLGAAPTPDAAKAAPEGVSAPAEPTPSIHSQGAATPTASAADAVSAAGVSVASASQAAEPAPATPTPAAAAAVETFNPPSASIEPTAHTSWLTFIAALVHGSSRRASELASNISAATLHAIHLTGTAASDVVKAVATAMSNLVMRVQAHTPGIDSAVHVGHWLRGHLQPLALELNHPSWVALTIGTSNGFTLSLRPAQAELPLVLPEPSDAAEGRFMNIVTSLIRKMRASEAFVSHLRRRTMTIGSYDIDAGGVGLAIPYLSATVHISRDPALPL